MKKITRLGGIAAVLALTITTAAQAHPGVYSVDARVAKTAARQVITVNATGGTFKPSAGATAVPFNAPAAAVETALQADPAIGYDNIDVAGADGGPYTLTWTGTLAGLPEAAVAPDASSLTGGTATATVAVASPGGAGVTFLTDALGASMATQKQYVVASDGFALGYKETNGVAGGGLLNLKMLPGGYRAVMTPEQKIQYTAAHTGIQLHATCTGVSALEDPAHIYATETRPDGDPFYAYIPWQATSAGLGDDPAAWIPAVKTITNGLPGAPAGGVDLGALSTVADFTKACTDLGGTYHPADTASSVAQAMVADAVTAATTPLSGQIATLTKERDDARATIADLRSQLATARADAAAARGDAASARADTHRGDGQSTRLTLHIDGPVALDGTRTPIDVTAPAGAPVLVRVVLSPGQARAAHLRSRLLTTVTQLAGSDGRTTVNVAIPAKLRAAAQKAGVKRITVDAISGDRYARTTTVGS